jgi:hypothetical protein
VTTGYGAVHNTMKVPPVAVINGIIIIISSSMTIINTSPLRRRPRLDCARRLSLAQLPPFLVLVVSVFPSSWDLK